MDTRSVAATAMNDKSSRSHAVVQLALDMEDSLGQVGAKKITRPRRSRANLVDLAGSEKVSKSKVEGVQCTRTHNRDLLVLSSSGFCSLTYTRRAALSQVLSKSIYGSEAPGFMGVRRQFLWE